jgi:hypothetical protein
VGGRSDFVDQNHAAMVDDLLKFCARLWPAAGKQIRLSAEIGGEVLIKPTGLARLRWREKVQCTLCIAAVQLNGAANQRHPHLMHMSVWWALAFKNVHHLGRGVRFAHQHQRSRWLSSELRRFGGIIASLFGIADQRFAECGIGENVGRGAVSGG